jgi:hypothetical protein
MTTIPMRERIPLLLIAAAAVGSGIGHDWGGVLFWGCLFGGCWLLLATIWDVPPAPLPDPPVNVRVRLLDGTVCPVDCRYVGVLEGRHQWAIINPPRARLIVEVRADDLPADTDIYCEGEW